MRWSVVVAIVVASSVAMADKRIDDLATGYAKESAACKRDEAGVAKVLEGAKLLPDEAGDTEKLDKGHAIVVAYCTELDTALELLKSATSYKAIEGKLDEADNKIRRARAASKKAVADLEPVLHRLIPKINAARVGPQTVTDHRTPVKFPSGRAVELPQLPGTWKLSGTAATDVAEYSDKAIAATVTAQPFHEATCAQERRRLSGTVTELEVTAAAKQAGVAWVASYKQVHLFHVTCAQATTGGVVATVEITPDDQPKLVEELARLGLRMVSAQLAPR
jgi:hypothetical protein